MEMLVLQLSKIINPIETKLPSLQSVITAIQGGPFLDAGTYSICGRWVISISRMHSMNLQLCGRTRNSMHLPVNRLAMVVVCGGRQSCTKLRYNYPTIGETTRLQQQRATTASAVSSSGGRCCTTPRCAQRHP